MGGYGNSIFYNIIVLDDGGTSLGGNLGGMEDAALGRLVSGASAISHNSGSGPVEHVGSGQGAAGGSFSFDQTENNL